jgi:hypothetical protein
VVIEGFEPEGFRHRMRAALSDVHRACGIILEKYDGDASRLGGVEEQLRPLLAAPPASAEARSAARTPWLAIGAAGAALLLCISLACLGAWQITWGRPVPTSQALAATSTPTPAPQRQPMLPAPHQLTPRHLSLPLPRPPPHLHAPPLRPRPTLG